MTRELPPVTSDLSVLLDGIAADFPVLLRDNLVGIYLWGSLTYNAFDERCSDVDSVVVTRRDLDDFEFAAMESWFAAALGRNQWARKLDMRFVIDGEFLDKTSRCCGFSSGKFTRHGSDGNPIIWLNIGACGITLRGRDATLIAPLIPGRCLDEALLLELGYLKATLAKFAGERSVNAFRYNAYAVLTACRIVYTARHRVLVSKQQAYEWALATFPPELRPVVATAWENRLAGHGETTPELEQDAARFVRHAEEQVRRAQRP